uniref:Ca2+ calmodulin dependent protein kinase EF-Hand protein superfamily n=1 Tax=Argas monolakensis TaxID=34602 RepID=Q09JT7_ARGMO|nr:Ca2+ calmodulin dependent protein kinase EF-Hand protein superfamily [Argas monolakensis]
MQETSQRRHFVRDRDPDQPQQGEMTNTAAKYFEGTIGSLHRPVTSQTRNDVQMKLGATKQLETLVNPVDKLRQLCLQRGSTGILGLRRAFRRMDDNGSGDLSREEFRKGLDDTGLGGFLEDGDYDALFAQFDADRSGTIKLDEFIRAVRPHMSPARQALVLKAFEKLDRSGDGQVTFEDFRGVYSVRSQPEYINGERTEKELLARFLASFEEGGIVDGIVTKEEFLDYYAGVSASIDEDGYFDLMMRSCWKL